jgi:hypothetical protein
MTLEKLVLVYYKREIVVVQSTEITKQKKKTYKKLLEQLNKAKVTSIVIAIC